MPLVSVVLPTYARNKSGLLRNAIMSVLAQDVTDFELLIVDDGSVDGSADTITEFAALDSRVRHIRFDNNVGLPAYTTGEAFRQSEGRYIAWQFDDCVWMPNHLSTLLLVAERHPEAGVFYGQVSISFGDLVQVFGEPFDVEKLATTNIIPNCATLIRREVYETVGWVDPSILLKRTNDHDLWMRAGAHFEFVFHEKVIAVEHGRSLADSLGNSVTMDLELVLKYIAQDRNQLLKIENMQNWQPCIPSAWMTMQEREQFSAIAFEHFLRVRDLATAAQAASSIMPGYFANILDEEDIDIREAHLGEVVVWYTARLNAAQRTQANNLGNYIQEQRKHIDEQQVHIENQANMIAALTAELSNREKAFEAQQISILGSSNDLLSRNASLNKGQLSSFLHRLIRPRGKSN